MPKQKAPFLLRKLPLPLMAVYADAVEAALAQPSVDVRSPGHIAVETRERGGGYAYWVRSHAGKPVREYVGPAGGERYLEALAVLDGLKAMQAQAKTLRKLGFEAVEHDAALVIAELCNAGVFNGGGVLIGTRAFGALLNHLGYKATPFLSTQDVDIARFHAIRLAGHLPAGGFIELLRQTGLRFSPVLGLERPPGPATSYKAIGKNLKVDLLAPARPSAKPYATVAVPELNAHATTLPFLDYLVADATTAIVVGRDHLIPIRCPQPARYCLHKLVVADLRSGADNPKIEKDLVQAGILAAILAEEDAAALDEAAAALSPAMLRHAKKALLRLERMLAGEHPAALAWLRHTVGERCPY